MRHIFMTQINLKLSRLALLLLAIIVMANSAFAIDSAAREYLRKAKFFYSRGNLVKSKYFLKKAQAIDGKAKEVTEFALMLKLEIKQKIEKLENRGNFFLSAKNILEAKEKFKEILQLDPQNSIATGKLKEIKKIIKKINKFKSQGIVVNENTGRKFDADLYSAISLINQAKALFFKGDREKSLKLVEQVLKREPTYRPALKLKKQILEINKIDKYISDAQKAFKAGKMYEYIDILAKLIEKSPQRHEFLLMRAKAYLKLKKYSLSIDDLLKYYGYTNSKKETFYLLSKAYFGLNQYDYAYGFSVIPVEEKRDIGRFFLFRCYSNIYSKTLYLIYLAIFLVVISFWIASKSFDKLMGRFPPGTFKMTLKCFEIMIFQSPEKCLDKLVVVARNVNTPWFNYMAGITLFKAKQYDGAQRFLAYAITSEKVSARAYYFFGLLRKILKQRLSRHDFEESLLASLDKTSKSWHPKFMKRIENFLLEEYSEEKSVETIEGSAYIAVKEQVGG